MYPHGGNTLLQAIEQSVDRNLCQVRKVSAVLRSIWGHTSDLRTVLMAGETSSGETGE